MCGHTLLKDWTIFVKRRGSRRRRQQQKDVIVNNRIRPKMQHNLFIIKWSRNSFFFQKFSEYKWKRIIFGVVKNPHEYNKNWMGTFWNMSTPFIFFKKSWKAEEYKTLFLIKSFEASKFPMLKLASIKKGLKANKKIIYWIKIVFNMLIFESYSLSFSFSYYICMHKKRGIRIRKRELVERIRFNFWGVKQIFLINIREHPDFVAGLNSFFSFFPSVRQFSQKGLVPFCISKNDGFLCDFSEDAKRRARLIQHLLKCRRAFAKAA